VTSILVSLVMPLAQLSQCLEQREVVQYGVTSMMVSQDSDSDATSMMAEMATRRIYQV